MLADASVAHAARTERLTLVASTDRSLESVSARLPDTLTAVHLLRLDWTEPSSFLAALREHVRQVGYPTLVVAWLHDEAFGPQIAEAVCGGRGLMKFVQVFGSTATDPGAAATTLQAPCPSDARFQRVILGFKRAGAGSRWLTHEEICSGVLSAIDSNRATFVVGDIEPWSARP